MEGKSMYKVPDGKLLKVHLHAAGGKVKAVRINGDFFLHPEEAIVLLEQGLQGTSLQEEKLKEKIGLIVEGNSIQLFGFRPADLARAIMMAVGK